MIFSDSFPLSRGFKHHMLTILIQTCSLMSCYGKVLK